MQVLQNFFAMLLSVATVAYAPVANADYATESEFAANGSIAQVLESTLNTYLMPLEVQQIGNSVYNEGQNYGPSGQAMTSSTPQMDFVSKHVAGYCSPNISLEQQFFTCTGQTSGVDAMSAQLLEMGDIRTSVLLEPTVYTDIIDLAAQNFIRNITMPFPSTTYKNYISNPSTFAKNTTQRKNYANYMANQALLGVARYAMDEMYGMRVPGSLLGASGNAQSQSIISVMENEATRRFTDPAYAAFLTNASTTQMQLMVEMAAMQSFELWMNYQNYRQNERIAALLSAILASNVGAVISQNNQAIAAGVSPQ
jgi:hypothetical protein